MSNYNHHGDLPELLKGKGIYRKAKSLLMKIARILNRIEVRWHEGNIDDTFFNKSGDKWLLELPRMSALSLTPVKATAEDTPEEGLHTFKKCDWDGTILSDSDEVVYESCRLAGDFDKDWVISTTEGKETFGLLFKDGDQNIVLILSLSTNAYYYE